METVRFHQWDWQFSNPNFCLRWIWIWEWQLLKLFCGFRQWPKTKVMYHCFLLFLLFRSRDWQWHFNNNSVASAYACWTLRTTLLANERASSASLMFECGLASGALEWKVRAVDLCTFSDTKLKWTDSHPGTVLLSDVRNSVSNKDPKVSSDTFLQLSWHSHSVLSLYSPAFTRGNTGATRGTLRVCSARSPHRLCLSLSPTLAAPCWCNRQWYPSEVLT